MKFSELVAGKTIVVPVYQRAFAWEDKQIELFIADLKDHRENNPPYYYGHFILEQNGSRYEVIDGQQRLTLAALFITYCHKVCGIQADNHLLTFAQSFKTVSYDRELYSKIQQHLGKNSLEQIKEAIKELSKNPLETLRELATQIAEDLEEQPKVTLSLLRLVAALMVLDEKLKNLGQKQLQAYLTVLAQANVSEYTIDRKVLAVQMFELHNTRGISLTFIDKVKAKLMQFVYQHGGNSKEQYVRQLQAQFAEIYTMEQDLKAARFRGNLSLQELFYYHLRMIDDGHSGDFNDPEDNNEEYILNEYLPNRLASKAFSPKYPLNVAKKFANSVRFFSEVLPNLDSEVKDLVHATLLFDKWRTMEFLLLICDNDAEMNTEQLQLWQKLLLLNAHLDWVDFDELYRKLRGKSNQKQAIDAILKDYVAGKFPNGAENFSLAACAEYINYRPIILRNIYKDWYEFALLLLYKYQKIHGANPEKLDKVIKEVADLDHIVPQSSLKQEWYKKYKNHQKYPVNVADSKQFATDIKEHIHGIGNLRLLNHKTNIGFGDKPPATKGLPKWQKPEQWITLIQQRGQRLINFFFTTFFAKDSEIFEQCREYIEQLKQEFDSQDSEIELGGGGHLAYYFDIGLPKINVNTAHIRLHVWLPESIDNSFTLQAEFWSNRIGSTANKVDDLIESVIELDSRFNGWSAWSTYYPIAEMDSFVTKLKEVIKKLEAEGFQPLPNN